MNFQHVATVAQFVVGTDGASCPTVDAPNEPCLQIGVNAPRQGFRVKTGRNNQRIGQHLTVTVHPVRFVLNRINNDVLELVEERPRPEAERCRFHRRPRVASSCASEPWIARRSTQRSR